MLRSVLQPDLDHDAEEILPLAQKALLVLPEYPFTLPGVVRVLGRARVYEGQADTGLAAVQCLDVGPADVLPRIKLEGFADHDHGGDLFAQVAQQTIHAASDAPVRPETVLAQVVGNAPGEGGPVGDAPDNWAWERPTGNRRKIHLLGYHVRIETFLAQQSVGDYGEAVGPAVEARFLVAVVSGERYAHLVGQAKGQGKGTGQVMPSPGVWGVAWFRWLPCFRDVSVFHSLVSCLTIN